MGSVKTHLGALVRESRERSGWSQEFLAEKLELARPISVSKWERGEAPIPVHHWQALMRVLRISRSVFLNAALVDQHKQLALFQSLARSLSGTASEIGTYSWQFILKSLAPKIAERAERLRAEVLSASPAQFVNQAITSFVEAAESATVADPGAPCGTVEMERVSRTPVRHLGGKKARRRSAAGVDASFQMAQGG